MKLVFPNPVQQVTDEIALPQTTRKDMAQTYALICRDCKDVDWGTINRAIMTRWSESGLVWIKQAAQSGSCWK